jgi:hypothetical protein
MNKLNCIIILFCQLFILASINAQKGNYGVFVGGNINILSLKSDLNVQDGIEANHSLSYNLGGFYKTNRNRVNFLGSLEYLRVKNNLKPDLILRDYNGINMGETKHWTINNNIVLSLLGTIKITDGLYFGFGIANNVLLKSTFKTKSKLSTAENMNLGKRFNNTYYKRLVVSIPIIIGYDFNRFDLFLRLNKGCMNRLQGDNNIHEIDNTLILGFGYNFKR